MWGMKDEKDAWKDEWKEKQDTQTRFLEYSTLQRNSRCHGTRLYLWDRSLTLRGRIHAEAKYSAKATVFSKASIRCYFHPGGSEREGCFCFEVASRSVVLKSCLGSRLRVSKRLVRDIVAWIMFEKCCARFVIPEAMFCIPITFRYEEQIWSGCIDISRQEAITTEAKTLAMSGPTLNAKAFFMTNPIPCDIEETESTPEDFPLQLLQLTNFCTTTLPPSSSAKTQIFNHIRSIPSNCPQNAIFSLNNSKSLRITGSH
ncbi:hypothetical protein WN51_06640 [Melipona quadrifasciata]|uniref:Uncharacterized protein n=1 Tax=Melipona quadrifasciata TaxID=166423 RepID=A0A0M8ZTZ1_9HYME|nr:hypothetical protein WN51_06640 [Melipona quadrifasciata]